MVYLSWGREVSMATRLLRLLPQLWSLQLAALIRRRQARVLPVYSCRWASAKVGMWEASVAWGSPPCLSAAPSKIGAASARAWVPLQSNLLLKA